MSATTDGERAGSGSARALPTGRLAAFEDDPAPDMGTLLSPRTRRRDASATAVAGAEAEQRPAQDLVAAPAPVHEDLVAAPAPGPAPTEDLTTDEDPGQDLAPTASAERDGPTPAASARRNRIKPSTVHVPARLMPAIRADRERTSRSNGELVIAAIEGAHPRLAELLGRRPEPTGGGLFASRASRGARLSDGDLTPLNVRLYEADWEVIDSLVAQFQAFSRGHLISTALLHFFDLPSRPQDQ